MFTFALLIIFSLLLLLSTTTAQPYNATDYFRLACGSSSSSTTSSDGWDGDERSKFFPANITTTSFSFPSQPYYWDSSVPQNPYSNARLSNTSSFAYKFPVSQGPKFLRLYFYPSTYSDLNTKQSYFSVSCNGYSLLTNFSASLTASFLKTAYFFKEFIIYVKQEQFLTLVFTPAPNSYAFINGIEIVSSPENLYYNAKNIRPVGLATGPEIADNLALETSYRLTMGSTFIGPQSDSGMYRSWEPDNGYIYGAAVGLTPLAYNTSIAYTKETPNYTAPELVYSTQRSMGVQADTYNLTWILPLDSGFYYMIRLHFCSIIWQYNKRSQVVFKIFINNQTAEEEADLFLWTQGMGYPTFRDYVVFVNDPDRRKSKQYLWIALHPNDQATQEYRDGFLNGLEAFKLSMNSNLASPNPDISPTPPVPNPGDHRKSGGTKIPYAAIIGGIGGGLVLLSVLVLVVLRRQRRVKHYNTTDDKSSWGRESVESKPTESCHSTLPSDRCRRFTIREVATATDEFNEDSVIGRGGFGKVFKGYMDDVKATVAIKRLNPSSSQGFREFHTEIGLLSNLRHAHLVSLIGYCDDDGEMVLVYDYMAHGTLREHLYRSNNPHLSWERRLRICIGAAQGLHYLHTGAKRRIIHRDVKSTNILLDENWVAKVSDFGLSKLGSDDPSKSHVSTVVKGSLGYVDPEYYQRQQLTDKSDVYSFGVVLLEVLCARPAMIPGLPKEQVSLAEWGKSCYRKGSLKHIVDPKIRDEIVPECLTMFGEVANSCLRDHGYDRPTMEEVIWRLELALDVQETDEKPKGVAGSENQELPFLKQGEQATTDDEMFSGSTPIRNGMSSGSTAIRNGTSSISGSYDGFKSETVFSEMLKPTGR